VARADTKEAVLYWFAAACLFWLGCRVGTDRYVRDWFLKACTIAGSTISVIGLLHFFTSNGLVFWLFPSGYESRIPGPFVSRNNYAAFVELLVPVALFLALRLRSAGRGYLVLSAMLVAAVVGCASRAGVVLVITETIAVFVLAKQRPATLAVFVVLSTVFVVIVGYQYLWERMSQDTDALLIRREILESTLEMIRAQPFHGFGLGAWTSAYPQFAVTDIGKFVNHAHNEWAQWAAEGGLPGLAVMLAVFLWTARAAVQSVWGLGLISVMVHSLVDYPFLRLGLAAWIFVLLGVLEADQLRQRWGKVHTLRRIPFRIPEAVGVSLLLAGLFYTATLGWADTLYRHGTRDSLEHAVRLNPDRAEYEMSLAQADGENAILHLERAAALNPAASNARIQLAAELEGAGETAGAERVLLEAAGHDHQFAPAWALANFYFRNGRPDQFWRWVAAAAKDDLGDLKPLFELCFLVSESADSQLERLVASRPEADRQFLNFLVDQKRLEAARKAALRIVNHAAREDRDGLLHYVDAALEGGQANAAWETWRLLCRGLVSCDAVESGVANGEFEMPILNHGFDWRLPSVPGVVVMQTRTSGTALSMLFSGKEPESCELLAHFLALRSGAHYRVQFEYRTAGLPARTGLYWSAGGEPAYEFDSAETWSRAEWHFWSSAETGRLSLGYRRYPGTTRLEGALFLRNVQLDREDGQPRSPAFLSRD
jgi:O-antigen ligase